MASKTVQANTSVQEIAAAIRNSVHKPTSMVIDNDGGSDKRVIRIRDAFTPDVTHGVSSPSARTADRHRITVLQGDIVTVEEKDLEGVTALGSLNIIADAVDTGCYITVGYKTE